MYLVRPPTASTTNSTRPTGNGKTENKENAYTIESKEDRRMRMYRFFLLLMLYGVGGRHFNVLECCEHCTCKFSLILIEKVPFTDFAVS